MNDYISGYAARPPRRYRGFRSSMRPCAGRLRAQGTSGRGQLPPDAEDRTGFRVNLQARLDASSEPERRETSTRSTQPPPPRIDTAASQRNYLVVDDRVSRRCCTGTRPQPLAGQRKLEATVQFQTLKRNSTKFRSKITYALRFSSRRHLPASQP